MEKNPDQIPENLVDFFTEELNSEEREKLLHWINQNANTKTLLKEYGDIWQASGMANPSERYDESQAWLRLKSGLKDTKPQRNLTWLKYAAVAIIFSVLGSLTYYFLSPVPKTVPITYQEVYVPYGSTSKITLPDGSNVWLNAGSYIKYDNFFNVKNRMVFLKGEAFFDVRKNKKLTFFVRTPEIEVKALGTKFNVKAYPEEKTILTTVVEGKILVTNFIKPHTKYNELYLSTSQSAVFEKDFTSTPVSEPQPKESTQTQILKEELVPSKVLGVQSEVNTELHVSWHKGKMIIEREKLRSLAAKLERRYNIKIRFIDEATKDYVFSGVLKDETFEQVMDVIRLTSPVHFSINGNIVEFSEDKHLKNRLK